MYLVNGIQRHGARAGALAARAAREEQHVPVHAAGGAEAGTEARGKSYNQFDSMTFLASPKSQLLYTAFLSIHNLNGEDI